MRGALAAACLLVAIVSADATPGFATPPAVDATVAARLRRLDCANIAASDVRDVLSRAPAPRIVLLQGSVPVVTMQPFARFLVGMGYPEDRLRDPREGRFSYSSFADSAALAGALAFDYEQSGMEPMLIGHSQGGMLVIRTLYEFAGAFHDALPSSIPRRARHSGGRGSWTRTAAARARWSACTSRTRRRSPPAGCRD